jgi:hypothetical protein
MLILNNEQNCCVMYPNPVFSKVDDNFQNCAQTLLEFIDLEVSL